MKPLLTETKITSTIYPTGLSDLKDDKLFVDGEVTGVEDAVEIEVITLDKRKFVSWTVDHQLYHILMEDAVLNYMKLKYSVDAGDGEPADEGDRTSIKEMKSTDQIIVVQQKGNIVRSMRFGMEMV